MDRMLRRPISIEGRHATRGKAGGLPGAKGSDFVSMCQIAVASSRAISTRATSSHPEGLCTLRAQLPAPSMYTHTKGQLGRQMVFEGLLERVEGSAS